MKYFVQNRKKIDTVALNLVGVKNFVKTHAMYVCMYTPGASKYCSGGFNIPLKDDYKFPRLLDT